MDYFGYSIWTELITGSVDWANSLELGDVHKINFEEDAWEAVFNGLEKVMGEIGLKSKMGGCLHTSSDIAQMLQSPYFDFKLPFLRAKDNFVKNTQIPLEMGMHSTFSNGDRVTEVGFPEVLKKDLGYADLLGATSSVEHFPPANTDITDQVVSMLCSAEVIETMKNSDVTLAWENGGPDEYPGSMEKLVGFREQLCDKLTEMGEKEMIAKHNFCLDTGHLLYWRDSSKGGRSETQKEIDEFFPRFCEHIKIFHLHANDGKGDNHLVPGSLEFFDHPSRKSIDQDLFLQNSQDVLEFLKVWKTNRKLEGVHIHVEALRMPFNFGQIIEFGKNIKEIVL